MVTRMKPKCHECDCELNVDTPMYANTKFSARKLSNSNTYRGKEEAHTIILTVIEKLNNGFAVQLLLLLRQQ